MGKTKIEWATDTWPVITGCSPVSEGCRNCYGARLAATRLKHHPHYAGLAEIVNGQPRWTGEVRFNEDVLEQPLRWKKPRVVFPCSMADWLHPNIVHEHQARMLDVMADERCEQSTFLLLTKRPEKYDDLLWWMGECWPGDRPFGTVLEVDLQMPENIWPGVTIENQDAMWRLEQLFKISAARYWASLEPLLGPIEFPPEMLAKLSGVVAGGESGPGARPMHPDWARVIRDQCLAAGVSFTFKQHGEWMGMDFTGAKIVGYDAECFRWSGEPLPPFLPGENGRASHRFDPKTGAMLMGKKRAGRELDGKVWDEFPWKLLGSV